MSPEPAALAPFAETFTRPDFTFGRWRSGEAKDGVTQIPWFDLSAEASAFIEAAYAGGWVLRDFAWPAWTGGNEAHRLREDPAALDAAEPHDVAKLLTALIRGDRFSEGTLATAFENGLLLRILRLVSQVDGTERE